MTLTILAVSLIILFTIELLYFKIANHYNIIDKPNHRSSHTAITIRGGGVIFPIALLLYSVVTGFSYPYFLAGLLTISFISFLDDIKELSSKIRIVFHLVAVALLFLQVGMFSFAFYWILLGLIFVIGTINAINFMDGINGITGGYGLITLLTLYYINLHVVDFTDGSVLLISIVSVLVFDFFNFRTKAKCFAGDVGSVSLAFIIVFFLLQLIIKTGNPAYLLLLLLYGLDTATTIVFRLIRRENIFKAHRSHFYQYLVNEKKQPHLLVAILYLFFQGIINIVLILFFRGSILKALLFSIILLFVFVTMRVLVEGNKKLFKQSI